MRAAADRGISVGHLKHEGLHCIALKMGIGREAFFSSNATFNFSVQREREHLSEGDALVPRGIWQLRVHLQNSKCPQEFVNIRDGVDSGFGRNRSSYYPKNWFNTSVSYFRPLKPGFFAPKNRFSYYTRVLGHLKTGPGFSLPHP